MAHVIAFGLLAMALIAAAVTDVRFGRVPNWLTASTMVGGLVYWAMAGWAMHGGSGAKSAAAASFLALAAGLVPFAIIYAGGGLGGGDVKLMGALGAMAGDWRCVLASAFYAFIIAAVMALVLMVRHRIVGRTLKRLFGAALVALARSKPEMPDDSPRVPFAAAICIGGLVAGIEYLLGVPYPWTSLGP